jgi:hypothetical protein
VQEMCEVARERFGILHCTIQPEVGRGRDPEI